MLLKIILGVIMEWIVNILQWCLTNLPVASIFTELIKFLRNEAKKSDTEIDDLLVDFLEMVLIKYGLIKAPAVIV